MDALIEDLGREEEQARQVALLLDRAIRRQEEQDRRSGRASVTFGARGQPLDEVKRFVEGLRAELAGSSPTIDGRCVHDPKKVCPNPKVCSGEGLKGHPGPAGCFEQFRDALALAHGDAAAFAVALGGLPRAVSLAARFVRFGWCRLHDLPSALVEEVQRRTSRTKRGDPAGSPQQPICP